MAEQFNFIVTKEDWSLHCLGELDRQRHREKVRRSINENLADIVTEENIIMSDSQKIVSIPVRSIKEYRFRYDFFNQKQVGMGNGSSKTGDVVGNDYPAGNIGKAKVNEASEEAGVDYYEVDISVEKISEIVFEKFKLPNFKEKNNHQLVSEAIEFRDIRKKGLYSNIDRKRTLLEVLKRNAMNGKPGVHGIKPEDLRYKNWETIPKYESTAVVIAMMDTSKSMGIFGKYIARIFYFWMVRFLHTKYEQVDIVFLTHHTEAKEVTEEEFFTKVENGGTRCSSVYKLALKLIEERYNPANFNLYAFHFSDGDNIRSDNKQCVELINKLLEYCKLVGYSEIEDAHYYTNTLKYEFKRIKNTKFITAGIKNKNDVYTELKSFFTE